MNSSEKIKKLVQSVLKPGEVFHIDIKSEWGSEHPNYRAEIRKGILSFLKANHPDEISQSVWDLNAPPVLPSFFVSISHCHGMGGFVVSSKSLGFDIEDKSRISQQVIDRVSIDEELKICPHFELLWPAKEAIFKCSTDFYTISHIQVLSWEKSQDDTFAFKSLTADGFAFFDSNHSYAVAIKKL